jgi:hypothetical protein
MARLSGADGMPPRADRPPQHWKDNPPRDAKKLFVRYKVEAREKKLGMSPPPRLPGETFAKWMVRRIRAIEEREQPAVTAIANVLSIIDERKS